jgi:hypothetical protein
LVPNHSNVPSKLFKIFFYSYFLFIDIDVNMPV